MPATKSFVYHRFDINAYENEYGQFQEQIGRSDGEYVLAQDALDREAVLQAQIRTLEVQLKDAKRDATHWKANHDTQVERARVLTERPDMPIERVSVYRKLCGEVTIVQDFDGNVVAVTRTDEEGQILGVIWEK